MNTFKHLYTNWKQQGKTFTTRHGQSLVKHEEVVEGKQYILLSQSTDPQKNSDGAVLAREGHEVIQVQRTDTIKMQNYDVPVGHPEYIGMYVDGKYQSY